MAADLSGSPAARPLRRRRLLWWGAGLAAAFLVPLIPFIGSGRSAVPVVHPLVGSPAPALDGARLLSGPPLSTGRWRLVVFFASWCRPCLAEMPELERLDRTAARVEVVSVATRDDPGAAARAFAARRGTWTLLADDGDIGDAYLVNGLPTAVLVDQTATVTAVLLGGVRAEDILAATG